jgi:hypothetical protein
VDTVLVLTVVYKHTNPGLNLLCRHTEPKPKFGLFVHVSNNDETVVYIHTNTGLSVLYTHSYSTQIVTGQNFMITYSSPLQQQTTHVQ